MSIDLSRSSKPTETGALVATRGRDQLRPGYSPQSDETQAGIPFSPAKDSAVNGTADTPKSESLASALSEWYDKPFKELPDDLGSRVEREWGPMIYWDDLTEKEREDAASLSDLEHNPATAQNYGFAFDCFCELHDLKTTDSRTYEEHVRKMERLPWLNQQLNRVREEMGWGSETLEEWNSGELLGFRKARNLLEKGFDPPASAEEIAMWVSVGAASGGIDGYWAGPFPDRFRFPDFDADAASAGYLALLEHCRFKPADLDAFQPRDRYLTYAQLLERLQGSLSGQRVADFVQARLQDGTLEGFHPITRPLHGSDMYDLGAPVPDLNCCLFSLSQVESIEARELSTHSVIENDRATNETALAIGKPRRQRHDAMSAEIEQALEKLGSEAGSSPHRVMHELKARAGEVHSCITEAGADYVLWCYPSGNSSKLTLESLGKRLYRRAKKGEAPR